MGYSLRSKPATSIDIYSKGNGDDQTSAAISKGSRAKENRTQRTRAERKSGGVLKPRDANIRKTKPLVKKTLADGCSEPRREALVSLVDTERVGGGEAGRCDDELTSVEEEEGRAGCGDASNQASKVKNKLVVEQSCEGQAGRRDNEPARIEQRNAGRADTSKEAFKVKNKPVVKPSTVSFQWLPASQPPTITTYSLPVFCKVGKVPTKHAIKAAERAEFHATYVTGDPSWTTCCALPGTWMQMQSIEDFSSNCLYRLSILAQRGDCSVKALEDLRNDQESRDRIKMCRCQELAYYPSQATPVVTRAGFYLIKHWREKLSYQLIATFPPCIRDKGEFTIRILTVVDDMLEHFKSEWLVDQHRRRPLPLWAIMEAMAWVFQTLPPYFNFCDDQSLAQRVHRCITLVGSAILTTIEVLIQYKLFRASSTIRNLSLVLSLFIKCTSSVEYGPDGAWSAGPNHCALFNDNLCRNNENGWASVVIDLAQKHGVGIEGVTDIDIMIRSRLKMEGGLKAKRDEARILQHAFIKHGVGVELPSERVLADAASKEGQPRGLLSAWKPEDDYDDEGIRYWKKWDFVKEHKTYYSSAYGRTREPHYRPWGYF